MDRRNLLRSILALGGAVALVAMPKSSEAASLFDELAVADTKPFVPEADLPAEGAQDAQWVQQCRWRVDRYGRRFRVCRRVRTRARRCWWTRDQWGRRIQVCR
jgi:hypothetical protein